MRCNILLYAALSHHLRPIDCQYIFFDSYRSDHFSVSIFSVGTYRTRAEDLLLRTTGGSSDYVTYHS